MFAIYLLCQIIKYFYNTALVILSIDKMSDFTSEFTFASQYSRIIKILFLNVRYYITLFGKATLLYPLFREIETEVWSSQNLLVKLKTMED